MKKMLFSLLLAIIVPLALNANDATKVRVHYHYGSFFRIAALLAYDAFIAPPARGIKKALKSIGEDAKDVGCQLRDTFK